MMEKLCDNCKNCLKGAYTSYNTKDKREVWQCIYGKELTSWNFKECSHFEAKQTISKELIERNKKALTDKEDDKNVT